MPVVRRIWRSGLLTLLLLVSACQTLPGSREVTRVAFGSCNRSDLPQPLWTPILESKPDLWVWTGDIVYGDTEDMDVLAEKYTRQRSNPGYKALISEVPVIGTWDDHDYGANDAGSEYPKKAQSQQLLLNFLDVASEDPRRQREGVYSSYALGEPPRQIKVILLDVRYHRDRPGPEADILGEAQWTWLQQELSQSNAQLNLIVSGTQVLPEQHEWERWAAYPLARERLLRLIVDARKDGVILLSGDRHFAELMVHEQQGFYPLYEVTASGMTHYWETMPREPNRARLGRLYKGLNFGLLAVDWSAQPGPMVDLQLRDKSNRSRVRMQFPLSRLKVAD